MLGLKGRKDSFRLIFPKTFICKEIEEKYANILRKKHSFYTSPIDFLNESIQKIQVFGFNDAVVMQQQINRGYPMIDQNRIAQNNFPHPQSDVAYRSANSPLQLIDKTLNVEFRMSLGYLNYFLLLENFMYQYSRDREYKELEPNLFIDIIDENGVIISKIELDHPIVNGMDMLDLDYSQPIAQSDTFKVEFKYSNFNYQFLDIDENTI